MSSESKVWLNLSVSRRPVNGRFKQYSGTVLTVYADPVIEEFMREAYNQGPVSIENYGDRWHTITAEPIEVYNGTRFVAKNVSYNLDAVGHPLLIDARGNPSVDFSASVANLSFLRIVGISKPEGIRLGLQGAHSYNYLVSANRLLLQEAKQFIRDYIAPIEINLKIVGSV